MIQITVPYRMSNESNYPLENNVRIVDSVDLNKRPSLRLKASIDELDKILSNLNQSVNVRNGFSNESRRKLPHPTNDNKVRNWYFIGLL